MTRRWVVGLVVLTLLVSGATRVHAEYIVTDLGTFGGSHSYAFALNDAGQVVGYAETPQGQIHAFLYSSGKMMDLSSLRSIGLMDSIAAAINGSGQVVINSEWTDHAHLYSNGALTDLGTLGSFDSGGAGLNSSGQVVGQAHTKSGEPHAFLYSGGKMTDLGTLGGKDSSGLAINDAGQVVGAASTASGFQHAFLYSGGKMIDLTPGAPNAIARAINASGQVVGDTTNGAFLYSGGRTVSLTGLVGANGINDFGAVVGHGGSSGDHALLFINGKVTDLNSVLPDHSGWVLENATAINNKGQLVGYGTNPSGASHAFLLTPVPEPSTLTLLGLGALSLAGHLWRKRLCIYR